METLRLEEGGVEAAARSAAAALAEGGVIIYPTDTLYGMGADACSDAAVARVYEIKGRWEGKPMHAIVSDVAMAAQYGEIDERTRALVEHLPQGKVTFVVKKNPSLNTGIVRDIDTFGFRIPNNEFCIAMARAFGKPITATSANKSGQQSLHSVPAILAQIGDAASHLALVVDSGEIPPRAPSTVIDLSGAIPRIIREGAVSVAEMRDAIKRAGWQGFDS